MSYEQWLRNLNLPEEAEKWRHRKNNKIILLEKPYGEAMNKSVEYIGLSGFTMTVTSRGVKFASQDNSKAVAFIDVGHVIKVYDQSDGSLLAALLIAQQKWGGVQLNGTDEYKRRCLELAARNGIRVANPELQNAHQEIKEAASRQSSMSKYALARELGKKFLREPVMVVTDAKDEKEYSGLLLGIIEKEGHFYAAQSLLGEHIILHEVSKDDLPALKALIGQEVSMSSGDGHVQNTLDTHRQFERERLEKSRGWSR